MTACNPTLIDVAKESAKALLLDIWQRAFFVLARWRRRKKMYPTLQLILNSESPVRCVFYTLVVRMDALRDKYRGGVKAFVDRYKPHCGKGIAVLCAIGGQDLEEPILDIEKNGLVGEKEFACFDAFCQAITYELMHKIGTEKGAEVTFPIPWLRGYVENGGVMVSLAHAE